MVQTGKLEMHPMLLRKSGESLALLGLGWIPYEAGPFKGSASAAKWFGVTPDNYLALEGQRVQEQLYKRSDDIPASAHTAADGTVMRLPWCVCSLRFSVITLPWLDGQWLTTTIRGWPLELTKDQLNADTEFFCCSDLWVRRLDPAHGETIDRDRDGRESEPLHHARASVLAKRTAQAFITAHCNELQRNGVVCNELILGVGLMELLPEQPLPTAAAGVAEICAAAVSFTGATREEGEMLVPSELPDGLQSIAVAAVECGCTAKVVEECKARAAASASGGGLSIMPCVLHARDHARDGAVSAEPGRVAISLAAYLAPGGLRELGQLGALPDGQGLQMSTTALADALGNLELGKIQLPARSPMVAWSTEGIQEEQMQAQQNGTNQ